MPSSVLKRALEAGLLHLGPAAIARARTRGRTLILAYHNIVPRGEAAAGDSSLHLPQASFAAQLDALQEACEVVPLAAALAPAARGDGARVAVTFDDAYAGALTAGAEELAARGLPATVFVAPGLLGGRTFWWDATAASRDAAWRREALERAYGHPDLVRERWRSRGGRWQEAPAHARSASAAHLRAFAGRPGMAVAAHGWLHLNFAAAPGDELDRELRDPAAWLAERFARAPRVLAYPYGLRSDDVERRVEAAGYDAALRVDGGWLPRREDRRAFAQPRLNVPAGISLAGFRLRLAGVLGG